ALAALAARGQLEDVIVHEMGHVLGLGPSWLLTGRVSDLFDPAYTGPAGVAAYQELGGNHFVPLENEGAVGTILGHWRESVFGDELMTGYLGARPAIMSRLTIAALADLGYGVDLSQAEDYSLLITAAARAQGEPDHGDADDSGHDHGDVPHSDPIPPFLDGIPGA
ncbi:MAG: leishmanolysin-related zinc metalloendopeptidase, partial [Microthrixaceae bacterium]